MAARNGFSCIAFANDFGSRRNPGATTSSSRSMADRASTMFATTRPVQPVANQRPLEVLTGLARRSETMRLSPKRCPSSPPGDAGQQVEPDQCSEPRVAEVELIDERGRDGRTDWNWKPMAVRASVNAARISQRSCMVPPPDHVRADSRKRRHPARKYGPASDPEGLTPIDTEPTPPLRPGSRRAGPAPATAW
jgi:hypothetical protein